jgi:hypothetical protein
MIKRLVPHRVKLFGKASYSLISKSINTIKRVCFPTLNTIYVCCTLIYLLFPYFLLPFLTVQSIALISIPHYSIAQVILSSIVRNVGGGRSIYKRYLKLIKLNSLNKVSKHAIFYSTIYLLSVIQGLFALCFSATILLSLTAGSFTSSVLYVSSLVTCLGLAFRLKVQAQSTPWTIASFNELRYLLIHQMACALIVLFPQSLLIWSIGVFLMSHKALQTYYLYFNPNRFKQTKNSNRYSPSTYTSYEASFLQLCHQLSNKLNDGTRLSGFSEWLISTTENNIAAQRSMNEHSLFSSHSTEADLKKAAKDYTDSVNKTAQSKYFGNNELIEFVTHLNFIAARTPTHLSDKAIQRIHEQFMKNGGSIFKHTGSPFHFKSLPLTVRLQYFHHFLFRMYDQAFQHQAQNIDGVNTAEMFSMTNLRNNFNLPDKSDDWNSWENDEIIAVLSIYVLSQAIFRVESQKKTYNINNINNICTDDLTNIGAFKRDIAKFLDNNNINNRMLSRLKKDSSLNKFMTKVLCTEFYYKRSLFGSDESSAISYTGMSLLQANILKGIADADTIGKIKNDLITIRQPQNDLYDRVINHVTSSGSMLHPAIQRITYLSNELIIQGFYNSDPYDLITTLINEGIDINLDDNNRLSAKDWRLDLKNTVHQQTLNTTLTSQHSEQPMAILDQLRRNQFFTNRNFQGHRQNTHEPLVNDFYRNIIIKLIKRYGKPETLNEDGQVYFLSKLTHCNENLSAKLQQQIKENIDKAKVKFTEHLAFNPDIFLNSEGSITVTFKQIIALIIAASTDQTVTESTCKEREQWLYRRLPDNHGICPTGYVHQLLQSLEDLHPDIDKITTDESDLLLDTLFESLLTSLGKSELHKLYDWENNFEEKSKSPEFIKQVATTMKAILTKKGYPSIAQDDNKINTYIMASDELGQPVIDTKVRQIQLKNKTSNTQNQKVPKYTATKVHLISSILEIIVLVWSLYFTFMTQNYAVFLVANLIAIALIYDISEHLKNQSSLSLKTLFPKNCGEHPLTLINQTYIAMKQHLKTNTVLNNLKLLFKSSLKSLPIIVSCLPHVRSSSLMLRLSTKSIKPFLPALSNTIQSRFFPSSSVKS